MFSERQTRMRRIWVVIILFTMVLLPVAGISDLPVQAVEEPHVAPINPDFAEFWENPPEPFYGYIPPPMDLSHLEEIPVERARKAAALPSSFDWRDDGKVTPVKNQNPCGTCWVHGTLAAVESKVLIEESVGYDFSEQNLACCTDPAWVYLSGNRCMGGGWSWLAGDTLTKKGTRLEACQPYTTATINTEACDDECDSIKMITDYRMIANQATDPSVIEPIKNAVYNHGPLAMSYAADDPPNPHMYPGNIYYWPSCPQNEVSHLVCIIGWDNSIEWPDHSGSGAWIVKNSWGTGWGNSGYFYLCYGSAGMCEVASLDYRDYDANEQIYYWDEAGQVDAAGCSDPSAWMANIFASAQDGDLTHVDFWTTSNNAEYEIYVYLDSDISDGLDNQTTSQSGSCQEFGYYSVPLSSPVSLSNGQSFIIAVKMTTPGFNFPLPIERQLTQGANTICDPPIQTGVSYARCGDTGAWVDLQRYGWNACLRARVTSGAAIGAPTATTNAATDVEETTATLNGAISNDGGEACQYRFGYGTTQGGPYSYTTWSVDTKTTGQSFSEAISSLGKGTKYYFIAQAKNSGGTASGSELSFLTKPDAPSSFTATTAGTTLIDLSWTKGDGAQKTKIQRKEGGYPTDRNDGTEVYFDTGTSKSDTGLTPDTTYYYRAWSEVSGSQQWSDNYAQDSATTTAMPDLVITEKYEEWDSFEDKTYTITYTVKNQGGLAAGASTTSIKIDGAEVATDPVGILAPDESRTNTIGPFTMSGDSDTILVCADIYAAVDESDEDNNCRQNEWGTLITGETCEVNCQTLANVTITLYDGIVVKGTAASDGSGNYTLTASISEPGEYEVVASKTEFKDESQSISITELGQEYELNFRGETGLIPQAADVFYVLECVNHWLFPEPPCELTVFKVLEVVNAWLFPT